MEQKKIIPMDGMRKLIADRMKNSLNVNAQLTHQVVVDMKEASELRQKYKKAGKKISFNDLILAAVTKALMDYPMMNSEITSEGIWVKDFVNIGIAVALDEGLIVPNIKNAHLMGLEEISATAADLASRARTGMLKASEYRKATFTVSNLGMTGLDAFEAIINAPEAGIIAVGRAKDMAVVIDNEICIRPMMTMTLSYDHRVVDGEPAARFLVKVREYLENPETLIDPAGVKE
ncbi:MAG: 2-oxo acid dehydrogenase subunit E2 [Firmicutes bacterium]|nr:2-oxo acid dehydrogenase subunit E2 [Bacillota bacterium]